MANSIVPSFHVCPQCGETKPYTLDFFNKKKSTATGLSYWCKACAVKDTAEWRKRNPGKRKITDTVRRRDRGINPKAAAPDEVRRAKRQNSRQKWKDANPEKDREAKQRYTENNLDKIHAKQRDYRINNPEIIRVKTERRRSVKMKAEGNYTVHDLNLLLEIQHGRCAYCGITLFPKLRRDTHIDHIHPLSKGGSNFPDNLALTCQFCNLSKADKSYSEWKMRRGW